METSIAYSIVNVEKKKNETRRLADSQNVSCIIHIYIYIVYICLRNAVV